MYVNRASGDTYRGEGGCKCLNFCLKVLVGLPLGAPVKFELVRLGLKDVLVKDTSRGFLVSLEVWEEVTQRLSNRRERWREVIRDHHLQVLARVLAAKVKVSEVVPHSCVVFAGCVAAHAPFAVEWAVGRVMGLRVSSWTCEAARARSSREIVVFHLDVCPRKLVRSVKELLDFKQDAAQKKSVVPAFYFGSVRVVLRPPDLVLGSELDLEARAFNLHVTLLGGFVDNCDIVQDRAVRVGEVQFDPPASQFVVCV